MEIKSNVCGMVGRVERKKEREVRTNEIETRTLRTFNRRNMARTSQRLNCSEVEVTAHIQTHRINIIVSVFLFHAELFFHSVSRTIFSTKLWAQNERRIWKTSVHSDGSFRLHMFTTITAYRTTVANHHKAQMRWEFRYFWKYLWIIFFSWFCWWLEKRRLGARLVGMRKTMANQTFKT